MNLDILFIKAFLIEKSAAGFYTASSAFARPVYWFLISFGGVALPLISARYKQNDIRQCKIYLSQIIRYSILIFLPIVVIISSTSKNLLILFYDIAYAPAGEPLEILIFGIFFVGMFCIFAHVIIAIGKEKLAASLSFCVIIIDIILNIFLIPKLGMVGASLATTISALILLMFAAFISFKYIGYGVSYISISKGIILCVGLYFIAKLQYFISIPLLLSYFILYCIYLMFLLLARELNNNDLNVLKNLFKRSYA